MRGTRFGFVPLAEALAPVRAFSGVWRQRCGLVAATHGHRIAVGLHALQVGDVVAALRAARLVLRQHAAVACADGAAQCSTGARAMVATSGGTDRGTDDGGAQQVAT